MGGFAMETTEREQTSGKPVMVLALLALGAGAAGMVLSFWFLASRHPLDVLAGAAGLVAGSVLLGAGLLALAVLSRSPGTSELLARALRCFQLLGPPLVAMVSGPVLYFGFLFAGIFILPIVLILCAVWA